jgi:hypothetical protein
MSCGSTPSIQRRLRPAPTSSATVSPARGWRFQDIADLSKAAPAIEGEAVNEPLPLAWRPAPRHLRRQRLQPRCLAAVRGISFPLLADFAPKGEVARRYGVWREQDGVSERAGA